MTYIETYLHPRISVIDTGTDIRLDERLGAGHNVYEVVLGGRLAGHALRVGE